MKYIGIIADGNRRWAKQYGLPPESGWAQGLVAIERVVLWAQQHEIEQISIFLWSTQNWKRGEEQVQGFFNLARYWYNERATWYIDHDVKIKFKGRRDRLPKDIMEGIDLLESQTSKNSSLILEICVDYGGRDEIVRAVEAGARTFEEISAALGPEPDCIIRTGGNSRLSDFLLWQGAYSEFIVIDTYFPAITFEDLDNCLAQYNSVDRTFGR